MHSLSRYENSSMPFVPLSLPMRGIRGLGDAQTTASIESMAGAGASATVATLVSLSVITGPVGAAIAGIIGVGLAIASQFKGCGQTCIQASNDANKFEPLLQQNLQTYMSSPTHYRSMQVAALNNFDTVWNALSQACSDPALGAAGQRCISDRVEGACVIHDKDGSCWDWFKGYRDPIANDPNVVPDPTPVNTVANAATGAVSAAENILSNVTGSGNGLHPLFLIGGLALLGFVFMSKDMR